MNHDHDGRFPNKLLPAHMVGTEEGKLLRSGCGTSKRKSRHQPFVELLSASGHWTLLVPT